MLLSVNAFRFLRAYFILLKFGVQTDSMVIAYEGSRSIITKNTLIPKFKFQTNQNQSVIGKPIHSWFIELNNYQLDKNYITIYNPQDPNKFIVRNNIEVFANISIVTGTIVSLIWLVIVLV
jgi:hypothetical protein